MHRIDSTNAVNGAFVAGNPVTGARPTFVTAAWHNSVQEELVNVVLAAGIELDKTNNAQLLQAMTVLIGNAVATALTAAIPGVIQSVIAAIGTGSGGTMTCQQLAALFAQSFRIVDGIGVFECPENPPPDSGSYVSTADGLLTLSIAGMANLSDGLMTLTQPVDGGETYTVNGNLLTIEDQA